MKKRGIIIKVGAHKKFGRLCTLNPYIDSRQSKSFHAIFDAIDAIDGWTEKEVQKPESVVEPEPAKPDPWAAVEAQESVTREGARKARQLFDKTYFKGEVSPLWHEWIASLYENWKFTPSEEQKKQACGAFEKLNLPFTDRKSYDKVRKYCGAVGIFPELLTNEESLKSGTRRISCKKSRTATPYQERCGSPAVSGNYKSTNRDVLESSSARTTPALLHRCVQSFTSSKDVMPEPNVNDAVNSATTGAQPAPSIDTGTVSPPMPAATVGRPTPQMPLPRPQAPQAPQGPPTQGTQTPTTPQNAQKFPPPQKSLFARIYEGLGGGPRYVTRPDPNNPGNVITTEVPTTKGDITREIPQAQSTRLSRALQPLTTLPRTPLAPVRVRRCGHLPLDLTRCSNSNSNSGTPPSNRLTNSKPARRRRCLTRLPNCATSKPYTNSRKITTP